MVGFQNASVRFVLFLVTSIAAFSPATTPSVAAGENCKKIEDRIKRRACEIESGNGSPGVVFRQQQKQARPPSDQQPSLDSERESAKPDTKPAEASKK